MLLSARKSKWLGVLLAALACSCSIATRDKKVGAGLAAGTALTGAAVYRAATGGCFAQCTHGRICDRKSGTCVEAARARPGAAVQSFGAPPADPDEQWWKRESPCPFGATLDQSGDERVIRCLSRDGAPEGPVTFLHGNGRKQMEGWNCAGEPCRVWTHWDEDGRVVKVEDLGGSAAAARTDPGAAAAACTPVAKPPTYDVHFDIEVRAEQLFGRVRAAPAKLRVDVWSSPAPTSCTSEVVGDSMTFHCLTDEAEARGRVSIVGEEIVVDWSTGPALRIPLVPVAKPAPTDPSAGDDRRVRSRRSARVPCGAHLRFHPAARSHGFGPQARATRAPRRAQKALMPVTACPSTSVCTS